MASRKPLHTAAHQRAHTIDGRWATKALRIDGHPLTVDVVCERLHRAGLSQEFKRVQAFVWGADAPPDTVRLLAYGCCELTVPERWIQHRAAHMALEAFFRHTLYCLPPADFSLRYTEQALQQIMRRIQRRWVQQLQQPQHTLRL